MEAFNDFSLSSPDTIFGGDLVPTEYSDAGGGGGQELLETEKLRVIYPA